MVHKIEHSKTEQTIPSIQTQILPSLPQDTPPVTLALAAQRLKERYHVYQSTRNSTRTVSTLLGGIIRLTNRDNMLNKAKFITCSQISTDNPAPPKRGVSLNYSINLLQTLEVVFQIIN